MRQLVHDVGIDQYSTVRKAYDRAKEILADDVKRRAELPRLIAIMEDNKEGMEWLRLEEDSFESVYRHFQEHLAEDRQRAEKGYMLHFPPAEPMFMSGMMAGIGTGAYEGYIDKKCKLTKIKETLEDSIKYIKNKEPKESMYLSLFGGICGIASKIVGK